MNRALSILMLAFPWLMISCGGGSGSNVATSTQPSSSQGSGSSQSGSSGSGTSATSIQLTGCDNPLPQGAYLPAATLAGGSGFSATGSLAEPRAGHTATLLSDGTVLVVGGGQLDIDDLLIAIPSAEIFSPSQAKFTLTSQPCIARENHSATLLPNGKVLIAGGIEFSGYPTWLVSTPSAELYDPASRTFTTTGSMTVSRTQHTATLLKDGRVLIAGGGTTVGAGVGITRPAVASAEIYDSVTGTFSATGNMASMRVGHTATLLQSGKVLITGGSDLATAELYDPSSNTFSPTGKMTVPRTGHSAVLLTDGRVLLTGGTQNAGYAPGGLTPGTSPQSTAEIYDPATGQFSLVGNMTTGRVAHTSTLLPNGQVLVAGGFLDYSTQTISSGCCFNYVGYESLSSAEIFDPASATFTEAGPMTTTRFWHTATSLIDGSVLIIGGIGQDSPKSSAEIYR